MDLNLAAIRLTDLAPNQIKRLAAGYERDHAMMLRLKPFSELADGRPVAIRITFDVQQQQILQRRNALALGGLFGKALKAPHLIAKLG